MKKLFISISFILLFICNSLLGQIILTVEGQTITSSETGWWDGYNVARAEWTTFSFLNNSITSVNTSGFLLQAGDESPLSTNNNLDGAIITGNKLTWNGTPGAPITHGDFMGYNINYTVRYNYLDKTPYGILFKSGTDAGVNMTYSTGYGAAYNIVKNADMTVRMKGINGVQIFNNTFYSNRPAGKSVIYIDANNDRAIPAASTGALIKNNIFYTVNAMYNIAIETGCLVDFECDYNIYYCEAGGPIFLIGGVSHTFAEWQGHGYDLNSVVVNPNFIDLIDFVPTTRLDYGTNLGSTWQEGLSISATWVVNQTPAKTTQNGTWQAGARVYAAEGSGTNYYVKNGGNDTYSGLSDALAWATIPKVNSPGFSYVPGDSILLKRGSTWNAELNIPNSGDASDQITYGAYGTGNKPIITARGSLSGWNTSGNWSDEGGSRWSFSYTGNYRIRVWLSGVEARRAHYTADMTSTYRWFYSTNAGDATPINRLWIYSATNPATAFSNIELSGIITRTLNVDGDNYVTFVNIDFRGSGGAGWVCMTVYNSDNITFKYCDIGRDAGCYGLKADFSDYLEVSYCTFGTGDNFYDYYQSETSEDGLSLNQGINYANIHHNDFISWGHTALGLNGRSGAASNYNLIHHNYFTAPTVDYGRAMGIDGVPGSMVGNEVYDNHCYDMVANIQINAPYLQFYNNIINTVRGVAHLTHDYVTGAGIQLSGYEGNSATNMEFYNNTIVNCRDAGIHFSKWHTMTIQNNKFINNIIAWNAANEIWGNDYAQILMDDDDDQSNNILNQTFRNNLLYYPGQTDVVYYGHDSTNDYWLTVSEFNAHNGTEGDVIYNNIGGDPLFVSSSDFHLQSGSPADGAGYSPTISSYDYDDVAWESPSAIGAYEYVIGGLLKIGRYGGKIGRYGGKIGRIIQ